MSLNGDDRNIIKLRGLPWNSTAKDIIDFLKKCQTAEGEKSIHLAISHRDGRPNGEAFVELATPEDVDKAFEYNKNVLGHRYIEIFNAKPEEFEMCLKRQNLVQQDTFIKLRGLPFSCKPEDIEQFFQGLEIRNGGNGIYIVFDSRGRPTGEAFVQFCNSEDTDLAMKKNREKIGQRYIEIFRSSSSECRRSTIFNNNNGGNNGAGRNNGGNGSGLGGFNNNNDRMGRGQRNNRTNFRDRPYPDTPWSANNNNNNNSNNNDAPWRNNNRSNNNFNDNFGGGNSNSSFNNDSNSNNFSSDFERNWNSGGNNSFSSFSGGNSNSGLNSNSGTGNNKGNMPFDRDNFGFNSFNNNSNSVGQNNFGGNNDRFMGNNGGNNMNNGGSQYAVHLRGMPYDCGENEVQQFFAPLKLLNVQILYNNNGRHTGEADAYFGNIADAQEAMKKHKEKMGSRYIELFAKSNDRRGGGGGGGGGNGGRF